MFTTDSWINPNDMLESIHSFQTFIEHLPFVGYCTSSLNPTMKTRPDTQHDCILERDIKSKQGTKYTNKIIHIVENVTNRRPLLTGIFTVYKLTTCPSDYLSPRLGRDCPVQRLPTRETSLSINNELSKGKKKFFLTLGLKKFFLTLCVSRKPASSTTRW